MFEVSQLILLLLVAMLQLLELHLNRLKIVLFGGQFLHFSLVHDLSVLECNLLWFDLSDDFVVLLKPDHPFTQTFRCV